MVISECPLKIIQVLTLKNNNKPDSLLEEDKYTLGLRGIYEQYNL